MSKSIILYSLFLVYKVTGCGLTLKAFVKRKNLLKDKEKPVRFTDLGTVQTHRELINCLHGPQSLDQVLTFAFGEQFDFTINRCIPHCFGGTMRPPQLAFRFVA